MQNRYAGDIGDYVKISLLRALGVGRRLGILWYLYPNEHNNGDGRHTKYLSNSSAWRGLDPHVFDSMCALVRKNERTIAALRSALDFDFTEVCDLVPSRIQASCRSAERHNWFGTAVGQLSACDLVFADPDNGLVDDMDWRRRAPTFGKQMPLSEARALSQGRSTVIYHHNSRFKGGHDAEVDHWLSALAMPALAVRATAYSCRTFFILNPDLEISERTKEFCRRWQNHKVRLHRSPIA